MASRLIILDQNYNNKVGCPFMAHIMKAPTRPLAQSKGDFDMVTAFKAGETVADYRLYDYTADILRNIPLHLVYLSFGMEREEFEQIMYEKHGLHPTDKVGVYFFKRV